ERLSAREIHSYRDLPQIWYQIKTKERDEARPRSGVLRTREFLMKDAYTLDPDVAALERSYAAHERAYRRIFDRCGLRYWVVRSEEHTSELQSRRELVCRLLLEKKKYQIRNPNAASSCCCGN